MNPFTKLNLLNDVLNNNAIHSRQQEDIYCLQLLQKLLNEGTYMPFTSMSLRPYVLVYLVNEIIINSRKNIIEFGAGISTLMLARIARMMKNDIKVISIEENNEWFEIIYEMLVKEDLLDYVTLLNVPLEKKELLGRNSHWYHSEMLFTRIENRRRFDLVLIDGPSAYKSEIAHSRYYALPFVKDLLDDNYVIFLDDANRTGEKEVMQMWSNEFGKKFHIYAETLGVFYQGNHFECNPIKNITIN